MQRAFSRTSARSIVDNGMSRLKTTTSPIRLPAKSKKTLCLYAGTGNGTPKASGAAMPFTFGWLA